MIKPFFFFSKEEKRPFHFALQTWRNCAEIQPYFSHNLRGRSARSLIPQLVKKSLDYTERATYMDKMNQAFEKMKMLVGMEVEDEQRAAEEESSLSFMEDLNRNCALTTKQRFYGFAICLSAGLACTLLSMLVFFNPVKFGITFTLGNLMALGSTAFLIGPQRQVTMMLDPARIYATALYLASIIIALFCALYVRNKLLTLLAIILEFSGLIWYSLSYIPFARTMVSKVFMTCFDTEF